MSRISGIPASIAEKDLESKVLEILEEIDVPIEPNLVEDLSFNLQGLAKENHC